MALVVLYAQGISVCHTSGIIFAVSSLHYLVCKANRILAQFCSFGTYFHIILVKFLPRVQVFLLFS